MAKLKSIVMACFNCKPHIQDKLYGPNKRVHNQKGKSKSGSDEFRCTVCGNVRS